MSQQTIYVFSSGSLRRRGNTLCLEMEEGKKYLPVETVRDVLVFGEVDVNKRVLDMLSQQEIVMHYFNYYGYYMGSFYPREHYNSGYMILQQAQHYLNQGKRSSLAREFVAGALNNMRKVLEYYLRRGKDLHQIVPEIRVAGDSLAAVDDVAQMMAIEGNARQRYYEAFDVIIADPDFRFERRTRRPPENRLNALISFGNSLVYATVLSEIYKTHLDPRIGYLHSTNSRRFSLNLDVAEVFKPILADRLVFSLLGRRTIQAKSFDERRGITLLRDRARRKFVEAFDQRLSQTIEHRRLKRKVSYRELIRLELYKIEKHLIGEQTYSAFVAGW